MENRPELKYEWQKAYLEAMLETDRAVLQQEIEAAEWAIFQRQQALSGQSDHAEEMAAINDALQGLRILKREKLSWPDWDP